jgi:hypothetical protein
MDDFIFKRFEDVEFMFNIYTSELWVKREKCKKYWKLFNGKAKKDGNTSYYRICINGRNYLLHRIIIMICYEDFDILDLNWFIDHRDHDGTNNSIENLNIVSRKQNNQNTKAKGYYFDKGINRWCATACKDGKKIFKSFKTEEDAKKCREKMIIECEYYLG